MPQNKFCKCTLTSDGANVPGIADEQERGGWGTRLSESICVTEACSSVSFGSLSSFRSSGDRLAHRCVCGDVFMCDPGRVPASVTKFHHLRAWHISCWLLRARTLSEHYIKVCVCVGECVCARICQHKKKSVPITAVSTLPFCWSLLESGGTLAWFTLNTEWTWKINRHYINYIVM